MFTNWIFAQIYIQGFIQTSRETRSRSFIFVGFPNICRFPPNPITLATSGPFKILELSQFLNILLNREKSCLKIALNTYIHVFKKSLWPIVWITRPKFSAYSQKGRTWLATGQSIDIEKKMAFGGHFVFPSMGRNLRLKWGHNSFYHAINSNSVVHVAFLPKPPPVRPTAHTFYRFAGKGILVPTLIGNVWKYTKK